jgi:hypothetical protein
MFTKVKVTQSMVDAVNSVISEKKMSEADLDETGLRKAAYAAHTAGQKMFSFKGKTYPVKVQGEDVSYGEAIEEAASGEVTKTKTGLIHKSTKAYGGSKPEKHVVDTLKGPKTKDLMKQDKEAEMKTRGRYDEELKGDQHKIDANKNNKIDAHDFALLRGKKKVKESFSARLEEKWKSMKEKKDVVMPEALEKSPEKNQDVADKSYLKDKPGSFKSDLKNLGRFIAGKKETNEEVEQIDEKNVPTSPEKWARAKAAAKSKFAVYPSAYANGWASKKYKAMGGGWKTAKEEVETEEYTEEQLDEMINEVLGKDATAGDWISDFIHSDNPKFAGKSKAKRKEMALAAYYAKQRNEDVELDEVTIAGTSGWKEVPKNVKDKSGAVHTPMSRAKDLARSAFKKVQDRTKIKK